MSANNRRPGRSDRNQRIQHSQQKKYSRRRHRRAEQAAPRPVTRRYRRNPLNHAVVTAIAASAGVAATPALAQVEEIVVTATKREESLQDVPVAVTALSDENMSNLRIDNFGDYTQYLPNVVFQGTGPGQNEIYIRGAATAQTIISLSSAAGLQPSVALYVDEQPVALQARNLDVYVTDLERIEVVTGPQGTVFGASSQAGTVRLITKKPNHDAFEAGFEGSIAGTKGGDMSNALEAYLNLPLSDELAFRVAAFNDRQGGWIDNIQNDPANGGYTGSGVVLDRNSGFGSLTDPANTPLTVPDNSAFVEDNFNDATYTGARFSLSWLINDKWDLLLQHTEQSLETQGVFHYDANLSGESSVNRFNPDENDDDFGLTTWTLNGRLGQLDVLYTGGYLDRDVESAIDYTGYVNGGLYAVYYTCDSDLDVAPADEFCYDPTKFYQEDTENTRFTHELRVSTPDENRWRAIGGIFYDEQELATTGLFQLASIQDVDSNGDPIPGTGKLPPRSTTLAIVEGINSDGGPFGPQISFVNDVTRKTDQIALFGNVEFDVLENVTAAVGARWYEIEDDYKGATSTVNVTDRLRAFGIGTLEALQNAPPSAAIDDPQAFFDAIQSGQLDVSDLGSDGVLTVDDVIFRASLDWRINEQILAFATFAQGFRPPTTNRVGGDLSNVQTGVFQGFRIPVSSQTDDLDNYELGVKTDLLDRTLRLNLTGYYTEIDNLQTSRFDSTNISFLWFSDNVGDAEIKGLEGDFSWIPTANLLISGSFSLMDTEITRLNDELQGIAAPVGSRLPYSAEFAGNIRARYDFDLPAFGRMNGWMGYVSGGISYTGDSLAGLKMDAYLVEDTTQRVFGRGSGLEIEREADAFLAAPGGTGFEGGRYVQDDYTLLNAAFGVYRDAWNVELFVDNLTDENAILNVNTQSFTARVVTNRPRTWGLRVSAGFE